MKLNSPLLLATGMLVTNLRAQSALTWQQVRDKFEADNPMLKAAQANIAESRANEITAHLRPNPDVSLATDGVQLAPTQGFWQPVSGVVLMPGASYLIERGNKRNLRYEAAKQFTAVAASTYLDQERTLLFTLRSAFVQTLQAKAVLQNAQENFAYCDRELMVNRTRLNAGDIAQVELKSAPASALQFESDLENATVPGTAILHLHDRDWVYIPSNDGHFRRAEVVAGDALPGGLQEVKSGLKPGDKVVSSALVLQSTVEQ